MRKPLVLAIALVACAATPVQAQATTQGSTVCHRKAGKIVHKPGERCIELRRTKMLVTVLDRRR